jgi:MFS family permease
VGCVVVADRASPRSLFGNRSFALFYVGQTCSYLGDGLRLIAIPLLVYRLTGSALSLGVTYALELLPFSLFSVVGGSLGDRLDRRRLMIVCDAVRFLILAGFAVAYAAHVLTIGMLYAGIAAIAVCAAIFLGGQSSTIPYLLGRHNTTKAIAALIAAEQVSMTIVPPIGGALFALVGPLPALAINAATYGISQLSIAATDGFGPDAPGRLPTLREIAHDVRLGFEFVVGDRALLAVTLCGSLFNFFGFMCGAVFIPFLKREFAATDSMVGWTLGIGAVGMALGSYVAGRIPASWPFGRSMSIAYLLDAVFFLPTAFTHRLDVLIVSMALTNACVAFEIATLVGWRMRIAPEEWVGRVTGVARMLAVGTTVPGAILGGQLADAFGTRLPIAISAGGYLLVAMIYPFIGVLRRERR